MGSETITTDYGFTGQRDEAGLGLSNFNARYYRPRLGRFIGSQLGADTIIPNPANPMDLNRYLYVQGNPLNRLDPTGHVAIY